MKKTKNLMWALAITVIVVFIIAIMANCVSAKWSYAESDPTTKDYFKKVLKGFKDGNLEAKATREEPSKKNRKRPAYRKIHICRLQSWGRMERHSRRI